MEDEQTLSPIPSRVDLVIGRGVVIPSREIQERVSRAGGPGGQRADKVSTRVSLVWNVATSQALSELQRARLNERLATRLTREGELVVHGRSDRNQARNREEARSRMVRLVYEALEPPTIRRPTRRTKGSKQRRLDSKKKRGETKRGRGRISHDS